GVWALGPYSQFGWHRPGPLYFYMLAPLYAAGGFRFAAINVGAALINLASLAVLLTVVARGSRSLVLWVPATLGVYLLRLAPVLVSAWNPHVIVMPLAALIAVSAALTAAMLKCFDSRPDSQLPAAGVAAWAEMISGVLTNRLTPAYGRPLPIAPSILVIGLAMGQSMLLVAATVRAVQGGRRFEASTCA